MLARQPVARFTYCLPGLQAKQFWLAKLSELAIAPEGAVTKGQKVSKEQ